MKKRKKQSFMSRISRNMLLLILVSNLVAYGFAYLFFYQSAYHEARVSGRNMLAANLQVVNQYFMQIDQIASAVLFNESLNSVLKAESDTSRNMQVLRDAEQLYYHSREDLRLVFYKENAPQNTYSIYTNDYYSTIADFKTSSWYQQLKETGGDKILLTNIHMEEGSGGNDFVHSLIYRIDDLYSNTPVGYLRIDMDLARLQKQLLLNYTDIEGIEILSPKGEVLFCTGEALGVSQDFLMKCVQNDGIQETARGSSFLCGGRSTASGWIVAVSISKAELYRRECIIGFLFLATLFLSLAVCLAVVDRNRSILNENIGRLTDGMAAIKRGNLDIQVDSDADDEIGQAIIQFNEMVGQIHELLGKVETQQALLDEAQIKALQQQINPHFIYNSLETLMGMASEGMDKEIIEICKCISAMLRYNTKMTGNSTIQEELEHVKNYIQVLEMRMGGNFRAQYSVDPECLDARIVKFSLQPLVENAINHGLANTARDGLVYVSIRRKDSDVEIYIQDNGSGMTREKLDRIRESLSMTDDFYLKIMETSSHTGLLNVHLRLKLYFNDAYRMEIESALGKGTGIRLRIPCRKEENHVPGYDCGR